MGVGIRYYGADERACKAEFPRSRAFTKIPGIVVQEGREEKRSEETAR